MTSEQIAEYVEDGARIMIDHDADLHSVFMTVKTHHSTSYVVVPEAKSVEFLRNAADEIESRIK